MGQKKNEGRAEQLISMASSDITSTFNLHLGNCKTFTSDDSCPSGWKAVCAVRRKTGTCLGSFISQFLTTAIA